MKSTEPITGYTCPECGQGRVHLSSGPYEAHTDGRRLTIPEVEQGACNNCDLQVVTANGSKRIDDWLDAALDAISPDELQAFLKKYQLTQKEASDILGIGEKSLSRWIRGHQRVSTSMSRYIRLLAGNETAFEQLREGQFTSSAAKAS